jgi:hypothetical protein
MNGTGPPKKGGRRLDRDVANHNMTKAHKSYRTHPLNASPDGEEVE